MASEVILPRLGQGMESGTIVRWLVSEGDKVEKGQPLYELDTDKVTQEVEADAAGVVLKIVVAEGEVPVGTAVAYVGEAGENVPESGASSISDSEQAAPAAEAEPTAKEQEATAPAAATPASDPAESQRPGTAEGSKRLRWRGGSRASAGSIWRRWPAPGPRGGSSRRTSNGQQSRLSRRRQLPRQHRRWEQGQPSASS